MSGILSRLPLPEQVTLCTHVYVNVRELRANLAAAVRRAESGQRVVITVAGRPVAQLGPLEPLAGEQQPTIEDLAARGSVVKARRGDRPPPDVLVSMPVGTRLDRLLAEVR
jgi:prevent-host-death family protein